MYCNIMGSELWSCHTPDRCSQSSMQAAQSSVMSAVVSQKGIFIFLLFLEHFSIGIWELDRRNKTCLTLESEVLLTT